MPNSAISSYSDPYEFQRTVQSVDLRVFVTGRGEFKADLTRIDLGHLLMQRACVSLPSVTHSAIAKNRRMIFLQFDPDQAPILHSGFEVPASEIICYPLGSDHHYRTSARYHCGGMSLTEDDFTGFAQALLGYVPNAPTAIRVVRPPPALMSRLLDLHKVTTDLAATAPELLAHPEVARAMEQTLVSAMISCLSDPATDERHCSSRNRLVVMQRFEQFVEAHQDESLYVTDVCAGIGISERSLRQHCHEQLGMSPHQYLLIRRMNLARRALSMADGTRETVAAIANDYGFSELGRFAIAYRGLFGESPSVTLRRAPDDCRSANVRTRALEQLAGQQERSPLAGVPVTARGLP